VPLLFVVVTFKEAVSVALLTEILLDSLAALTGTLDLSTERSQID